MPAAQQQDNGYVHLKGVLSPEELAELDDTYMRFLRGEAVDPSKLGKDFCA